MNGRIIEVGGCIQGIVLGCWLISLLVWQFYGKTLQPTDSFEHCLMFSMVFITDI